MYLAVTAADGVNVCSEAIYFSFLTLPIDQEKKVLSPWLWMRVAVIKKEVRNSRIQAKILLKS